MDKEHAQRIIEWRESIARMPDNQFFELMRMYVGEVKTPFNKQKLVEELSVFLRKIENKEKIAKLLSESDMKVIAAIKFIGNASLKKLTTFFEGTFTYSKLYERIINLEERLIIYKHESEGRELLHVNPHLDVVFDKIITKSLLVKCAEVTNVNTSQFFSLTPGVLAAFASYVNTRPSLCKADGTFKKKVSEELDEIFSGNLDALQLIKNAFENLSVIAEDENGKSFIDRQRFSAFAKLPETIQYAYITVASQGRFSRSSLMQQSKLLIETILNIPNEGYTKENLLRSAYLKTERKKDNTGEAAFGTKSRFAALMQKAAAANSAKESEQTRIITSSEQNNDDSVFSTLGRLIESAQTLGLIRIKGIEKDGTDVLEASSMLEQGLSQNSYQDDGRKVLNIDAAYNVMMFPGLSLEQLIPLSFILEIRKFDTAVSFEITKKSVMHSFDLGMKKEYIEEILKKRCVHDIPQNLLVSLDDWEKNYSSATVYKGYILKVSSENTALSEKNPNLAKHIVEILAPGIYLLDVDSDDEAREILESNGTDFVGKIKTAETKAAVVSFPTPDIFVPQNSGGIFTEGEENGSEIITSDEERKAHFDYLRGLLREMRDTEKITQEEYECLLFRVNRKIVIDESQLKKESVKFAKLEASGMDFPGKVHLIEQAVTDKSSIEITFMSSESEDGIVAVGLPVATEKSDDDVTVTMKLDGTSVMKTYSISQASKVRRIYGSAFV
ncbi:MAG: hypothetical protein IKO57_05775 [Treponema sp.]|nr:hypothetical protein [Treponema sp.]